MGQAPASATGALEDEGRVLRSRTDGLTRANL
jgi:hypothetical protein